MNTEKYIGIPYVVNGRDYSGIDCWGLVRLIHKEELNIDLPSFIEESINPNRVQELIALNKEGWEATTSIEKGDVIIFKVMGVDSHIAIAVSPTHFLHARQGHESAIESFDSHKWKNRFVGSYKYKQVSNVQNVDSSKVGLATLNGIPHPLRTERITKLIPIGMSITELEDWILTEYKIQPELKPYIKVVVNGVPVVESMKDFTKVQAEDCIEYRVLARGGNELRTVLTIAVTIGVAYATAGVAAGGLGWGAATGSALGIGSVAGTALATIGLTAVGMALVDAIAPVRLPNAPSQNDHPGSSVSQLMITGGANRATPWGAIPFVLGRVRLTPPLGANTYSLFNAEGTSSYLRMLLVWGYGPLVVDESTLKIGELSLNRNCTYSIDSGICTVTFPSHGLLVGSERFVKFLTSTVSLSGWESSTYKITQVTQDTFSFGITKIASTGTCLAYNTYEGLSQLTLNRIQEPSAGDLSIFNGLYGNDTTQVVSNTELSADGSHEAAIIGPWLNAVSTDGAVSSFTTALHFPQGCRKIASKGDNAGTSSACPVIFELQYKKTSDVSWVDYGTFTVGNSPIKDAFTKVIKVQYESDSNVQVRIRRLTGTGNAAPINENFQYAFSSTLLDTTFYRNTQPAIDPVGCKIAKTAFEIKASQQLNSQIQGINAVVQTYGKAWNGTAWVDGAINNPAALFRHVLEHPANPRRVIDTSKIDLVQLQHWHEYCTTKGFTFNSIVSTTKSVLDVLRDICSSGRASPSMLDGKWTVVIDEVKPSVIQHFSPHNSWGFEGTKALPKIPDGLKVSFINEDKDYQQDETIVYNTSKSISDAALLESISVPGVTTLASAQDHARWHMAQAKLRPERYTLNSDIEYIVCNRGDRVKVMQGAPMWGLGSGRIKNKLSATLLEITEHVPITSSLTYGIRFRSSSGGSSERTIQAVFQCSNMQRISGVATVTSVGHPISAGDYIAVSVVAFDSTSLTETSAYVTATTDNTFSYMSLGADIPSKPCTGTAQLNDGYYNKVKLTTSVDDASANYDDLFLYGEYTKESQDCIVLSIEPMSNKSARLTLVDYGVTPLANIFTDYLNYTDALAYSSGISLPPELVRNNFTQENIPVITNVTSSSTAADRVSPGVWLYNISIAYINNSKLPTNTTQVECQYDLSTASSYDGLRSILVPIESSNIYIPSVKEGVSYKFRLRYVNSDGVAGVWSTWQTHAVMGFVDSSAVTLSMSAVRTTKYLRITPVISAAKVPEDFKGYSIRVYKNSGTGDFWNVVDSAIIETFTTGVASINLRDFTSPRMSQSGTKYRIACRVLSTSNKYISTTALADILITSLV